MSLSTLETLELSAPSPPPGLPRLFRERIEELGIGSDVDRKGVVELCGSTSAGNQFLHKASKIGALVPTGWGEYRVADAQTLALIGRVGHPSYQRFISWARHLPEVARRSVLFVAPCLWRFTELNIGSPMPMVPLDRDETEVEGLAPQWDAFYMDVDQAQDWQLLLRGEPVLDFQTPGSLEVVLLLRMSLDPRWREAAQAFDEGRDTALLDQELSRMRPREAPRGAQSARIGLGPPHRRRFRAPPWYMDMVQKRLADAAVALGV